MPSLKSWCPLLILVATVSACNKRPPATAPFRTTPSPSPVPARPPSPPPPPPATARPAPARLSEADLFQRKSLDELNAEHPLGDVFFDYDEITLREDARRALQQDAQWLSKWPQTAIRVDGHCDERGTAEYNLALGERRAGVVRDYLSSLGIRPERIQTQSFGKEAPFCRQEGEACWSQNRRGHFVITAK